MDRQRKPEFFALGPLVVRVRWSGHLRTPAAAAWVDDDGAHLLSDSPRMAGALSLLGVLVANRAHELDSESLMSLLGIASSTLGSSRSALGTMLRTRFRDPDTGSALLDLARTRLPTPGKYAVLLTAHGRGEEILQQCKTGEHLADVVETQWLEPVARLLRVEVGRGPTEPAIDAETVLVGPLDIEMIYVPGGFFRMGLEEQPRVDLRPEHWVHLSPFLIGKRTVTNRQWRRYAQLCKRADADVPVETLRRRSEDPDQPVVWVSRDDIQGFLEFTGLQLPTEAQWEFAAAGPSKNRFPWGDAPPDKTRAVWGRSPSSHAPVASDDRASWCGCLDMAGSVWEWTADWYGPYTLHSLWDPTGPAPQAVPDVASEELRRGPFGVLRGGGLAESDPSTLETVTRGANYASHRAQWDGFRVAAALDWRFLSTFFKIPVDIVTLATQEAMRVIEQGYRVKPAEVVDAELRGARGQCTFAAAAGERMADGQYTVFDVSGAILVHRHGRVRGAHLPWRDAMGVDAHALVVAAAQTSPTGKVCWVDDLAWRQDLCTDEFARSEDGLRYSCAAFVRVPGLSRFLVVEVHWFDVGLSREERRQRLEWFRRAGWYAPTWLDLEIPS
ncbi:MAG: SUMF1/EgtB/PvdO family nonheme iron enzyme [Alphaproteobacteria bacterium]|nr:SUMF1/EgtB/PvdO family nonheme iron enzyme [Alphaproteobacteria bacterium]